MSNEQDHIVDSNKKITAVEHGFSTLAKQGLLPLRNPKNLLAYKESIEMEKKQAFEFWQGGINSTEEGGKSFDQYYKENYES